MGILDKFYKAVTPAPVAPVAPVTATDPAPVAPVAVTDPLAAPVAPVAPVDPKANPNPNNIDPKTGKQPVSGVPDTPPTLNPNDPTSPRTHANPLDVYSKILDNANKGDANLPPVFDIPEVELDKVVNGLDFTSIVPAEVLEKAVAGGDPKAFMEVLTLATRQAYKTAIQHGTKLTEAQFGQRLSYEDKRIQDAIKGGLVSNSLSSVNNYDHPVARKELNRVAAEMAIQFPDKSPQQIADASRDYLQQLAASITSPTVPLPGEHIAPDGQKLEFDWGDYLSKNSSTS